MKRRDKHQWMLDRINDPYFIKAKKDGFRARSAYKLIEIHEKFCIIPEIGYILDLGCAPGAWLQVLKQNTTANLIGIDLLNIEPLNDVEFLKGDIFSEEVAIYLSDKKFHLILSDIAPNCMGVKNIDHLKIMSLADRVLIFIKKYLNENGNFCIKLFDGKEVPEYIKSVRYLFKSVRIFKPKSSTPESNEIYLVCKEYKKK